MDCCPNRLHGQGIHEVARNCDTGVDLEQQHERRGHQCSPAHAGDADSKATDEPSACEQPDGRMGVHGCCGVRYGYKLFNRLDRRTLPGCDRSSLGPPLVG